jgi:hypothetical protein
MFRVLALSLVFIVSAIPTLSVAELVCGKVVVKNRVPSLSITRTSGKRCARGFSAIIDTAKLTGPGGAVGPTGASGATGIAGAQGLVGPTGSQGAEGANGSLRIYGDGSDGDNIVAVSGALTSTSGTFQFENLTIQNGITVTIPSGIVVRCRGNFINRGTITVGDGARGGGIGCNGTCNGSNQSIPHGNYPHPGIAFSTPQFGEIGDNTAARFGGGGGTGVTATVAKLLLRPGLFGGGGGLGISAFSGGLSGGGSLVILAKGSVLNDTGSVIRANASNPSIIGTGGAGGGVIILASATQLTNSGTIEAKGGSGLGASGISPNGSGGGGGGGIVHLISPIITAAGTANVSGGAGGAALPPGTITSTFRIGGVGGAGSGGNGGGGGAILTTGAANAAAAGTTGHALQTLADPTSLF